VAKQTSTRVCAGTARHAAPARCTKSEHHRNAKTLKETVVAAPHKLIEQVVQIEWNGKEPGFLQDRSADTQGQTPSYKVLGLENGLMLLQRDVSRGVHGVGPHDEVWVPLDKILGIRIDPTKG
jgi:hypothetical protein